MPEVLKPCLTHWPAYFPIGESARHIPLVKHGPKKFPFTVTHLALLCCDSGSEVAFLSETSRGNFAHGALEVIMRLLVSLVTFFGGLIAANGSPFVLMVHPIVTVLLFA